MAERVLVTGVLGCLGAWTASALLERGDEVVGYDLGTETHRLGAGARRGRRPRTTRRRGRHGSRRARPGARRARDHPRRPPRGAPGAFLPRGPGARRAGQRARNGERVRAVPSAARADPRPGLRVARRRSTDRRTIPGAGGRRTGPATHYGVFKAANEGAARIYWEDETSRRSGSGRTSCTAPGAIKGSRPGQRWRCRPRHTARDSDRLRRRRAVRLCPRCRAHVRAGVPRRSRRGDGRQLPRRGRCDEDVVSAIEAAAPGVEIGWNDVALPFPAELEAHVLEQALGDLPRTPLDVGVAATVGRFRDRA